MNKWESPSNEEIENVIKTINESNHPNKQVKINLINEISKKIFTKNVEEIKTIAEGLVFTFQYGEYYKDFKVNGNTITYLALDYSDTNNYDKETMESYEDFFNFVSIFTSRNESDTIQFIKKKLEEEEEKKKEEEEKKKEEEKETTPWYKQWWVWLLIILAILLVLGLGYYMMKGKKSKNGKK